MQHTPIVIRYEGDDEIIHTDEHPFCSDATCPCYEGETVKMMAQRLPHGSKPLRRLRFVKGNEEKGDTHR